MNLIVFFSFLTLSLSSMATINEVSSGDAVTAAKMNELIQKVNLLEQKVLPVGSIVHSLLTLSQFQIKNGDCWKLMDGSSIVGTDLAAISGMGTLPNTVADGSFLRQAKAGRTLGSSEGYSTARPINPFSGNTSTDGNHRHDTGNGGTESGSGRK